MHLYICLKRLKNKKKKEYAKQGIVELQGSIGFSTSGNADFSNYNIIFSFYPTINVFFVDNIHIGLTPGIGVYYYSGYDYSGVLFKSTSVDFMPGLFLGYTFTITPNTLYFDISGLFSYNLSLISNYPNRGFYNCNTGLNLTFKYIIHNSSINFGLYYHYENFGFGKNETGYHAIGLILGVSIFL